MVERVQALIDHILPVPPLTLKHGGQLVADSLKKHGADTIFCLTGGHISTILVGCEKSGIRVVDVRHEASAVFAADAYGRLTGLGVAAVTAGPGVTNTVTAVKNAYMAMSPLVLLGGASPTLLSGRGSLQDIDHLSVLRSCTKKTFSVRRAKDIGTIMREAIWEAKSGVPGPVFIELPIDVIYPPMQVQASVGLLQFDTTEEGRKSDRLVVPQEFESKEAYLASLRPGETVFLKPQKLPPYLMRKALNFKTFRLHDGLAECEMPGPKAVDMMMPRYEELSAAVKILQGAKQPVVVVGSQIIVSAHTGTNLQQTVEAFKHFGAPTYLGGMARGFLGRDAPFFIRQNRKFALKNADAVLMLGLPCDFRLDYGRALSPKSKIITVNLSARELTMNADALGFWRPALACRADPGEFLRQLTAMVDPPVDWKEWTRSLKLKEQETEKNNEKKGQAEAYERSSQKLLNPVALLAELEQQLPDNALLIGDGGDFVATAAYTLRPRAPLTWLDPGPYGTLGCGGGFGLGAKLACPDKEVWILWGDGACGYSILEYDSFVRHKAPVISLIGNDAAWAQIERDQHRDLGSPVACVLDYSRYERVGEAFGAAGLFVDTKEEVVKVLQSAREKARTAPVIINALIGKSSFREGSISV